MDSRRNKIKTDTEDDRLSVLPDDLILKILSFVCLKDATRTSVLSPRWRFIWASIPHLSFSSEDFPTMCKLSDVVTRVLSRRNNQIQLSSFKLYLHVEGGQDVAQRIVNYAFSLNVQQVNITYFRGKITSMFDEHIKFPLSLTSSQTLKHLTLSVSFRYNNMILTSVGEYSSLTTLQLYSITLCDGFFAMCPNLENMTLNCCQITGSEVLSVHHPRLSNLTLEDGNIYALTVDVVTPQLKNLTISQYYGVFRISAPNLASLVIRGLFPSMFSTNGFHYLGKAQLILHNLEPLCGPLSSYYDASTIISLLQEFRNVKSLSLSMEVIKLLNSFVELISHQPPPLANLKSLKILPNIWNQHVREIMSIEVKNFLLNGSPKATLIEVLSEQGCDVATGADPDSI